MLNLKSQKKKKQEFETLLQQQIYEREQLKNEKEIQ